MPAVVRPPGCPSHGSSTLRISRLMPTKRPVIVNGLSLSKIHHAAYDANLIGVDPDGAVHVSDRLLSLHDGPMLEQGLKGMKGRRLRPPLRGEDCPDRDRLAIRF